MRRRLGRPNRRCPIRVTVDHTTAHDEHVLAWERLRFAAYWATHAATWSTPGETGCIGA